MSKVYFQIGTNDGDDNFRKLVINNKPDLVILVEPNKRQYNHIKYNYENISNVNIYINALYYNNEDTVELYIPAKNGIIGNPGANGITYANAHFSLVPMNDWGVKEHMAKIKAKAITFDEICRIHNITEIDYLQIDTEGFDSEIIKMIDLTKYKIKKIRFEKWGFKPECFTEFHPDKYNELGVNGMKLSLEKLKKHNYVISEISDDDGNDYIATLQL